MATQSNFTRSFQTATAMSANRRVALSTGTNYLSGYADNTVPGIGVLQEDVTANAYERPVVRLYGTGTTRISITAQPVTANTTLYAAANGQVAPTGTVTWGYALQGSTTNGDVIEAIPLPQF